MSSRANAVNGQRAIPKGTRGNQHQAGHNRKYNNKNNWPAVLVQKRALLNRREIHSSGAVWESRWTSWAVRPNEPSGFRGRKDLLHRASALVTTCP